MKVVYLSGGVGGARLLWGLHRRLGPAELTVVVNTGDDFEHWGLRVCPDLDTVMYTLAGLTPWQRGWGVRDDGQRALEMMRRYGAPDWFALGDADLATHLRRSERLRSGVGLSDLTRELCAALDVRHPILPMSDAPLQTLIETQDGRTLPFQTWFVQERSAPRVRAIHLHGAYPDPPPVLSALAQADAVVIGPSNPFLSIDPILRNPQVRAAVAALPRVAVSPIIHGQAVKGPLADLCPPLLGCPPGHGAIATYYAQTLGSPLAGWVHERGDDAGFSLQDAAQDPRPQRLHATQTLMTEPHDSLRLADEVLALVRDAVLGKSAGGSNAAEAP